MKLVTRYLIAHTIAALAMVSPASAQSWTVGEQPITYTPAHVIGDGSDAQGGLMPSYAYEAADIPNNFDRTLYATTSIDAATLADHYKTVAQGAGEAKARFDCNTTHTNHDDAIVAQGIEGGGPHHHTYSGQTLTNYATTYQSARADGYSACYGGPLNRTPYWEPSLQVKLASGVVATRRAFNIITYYVNAGGIADPGRTSRWPLGIAMIGGFNPADPKNIRMTTAMSAANAANGTSMALPETYTGMPANDPHQGTGMGGWICENPIGNGSTAFSPNPGQNRQPYFTDQNGNPTLACNPGTRVYVEVDSQPCSDGRNLTSPDGRGHMVYAMRDNNTGQTHCPDNYFWQPVFSAKVFFQYDDIFHQSYLSSDRMGPANTPADPNSMSPCRRVGPYYCNGETMHFDLIPAWEFGTHANPGAMVKMFKNCLGIKMTIAGVTQPGTVRECGFGIVAANERLIGENARTQPADAAGSRS